MPTLIVIAGPNGSGKSTLGEWVHLKERGLLLDADSIARELDPLKPRRAGVAAGRETLRRIAGCFERGDSFAIETTLSGRNNLDLMLRARAREYEVYLVFVALDTAERCIARILARFLQGGHSIPEEDVRRRYQRSLRNLPRALRLADTVVVYDNSGSAHRLIFSAKGGRVTSRAPELPSWLRLES